ncbi:helix-turn-helix transcriptional regulator [Streptomyces sp. WMMB303]|uniref:helix-turn-helix transcriptional regulator n=1 Tax=Streptomyces sp. WMMB303 TaxID=3034154 RepID=UPI0023EBF3AD|nr:helix-turn-helix transcriptional regulator [Streptomyces sp. WMMB303]MDF4250095.1 helix-turn-helix transcriptional regulator [Streptomyces sp. WMMB303]
MGTDVGASIRRERTRLGWTQPQLARAVCREARVQGDPVGRQEISRWETGKRKPREWLPFIAAALGISVDVLTGAPFSPSDDSPHIEAQRRAGWMLGHGSAHGGNHVADAAVQVWRSAQAEISEEDKFALSVAAELGEVAGWLLFDAGRDDEAHSAFMSAQLHSRLAGDAPLSSFILDMLCMASIGRGTPGESLAISGEILGGTGSRPHMALMAHVRRARALAMTGDRARALDAIQRAEGGLDDSVREDVPEYLRWIDRAEVDMHHGETLLALDSPHEALPYIQRATAGVLTGGRRELGVLVCELDTLVRLHAWRDVDDALRRMAPILRRVSSDRHSRRLRSSLRVISEKGPAWLADSARECAA